MSYQKFKKNPKEINWGTNGITEGTFSVEKETQLKIILQHTEDL